MSAGYRELHVKEHGFSSYAGGEGESLVVLIHGLGANAAVWLPLLPWLEAHVVGRWIAPDLAGHGAAGGGGLYGTMAYAADMARLMNESAEVVLVGHSLGGVVAIALATGWFGPVPRAVLALSTKMAWTEEELAARRRHSARQRELFDAEETAAAAYLRATGLQALLAPAAPEARRGVVKDGGQYKIAADPGIYGASPVPVAVLVQHAVAPVIFATGEHDRIAPLEPLRALRADAVCVPGAGHNLHVSHPGAIATLIASAANARGHDAGSSHPNGSI